MTNAYKNLEGFQKDYEYDLSDKENHLGAGTYGRVTKAWDNTNHEWVALKIGEDLLPEFAAAQELSHRNIGKYLKCYRITDRNIGTKDYAIMKYYPDGNLAKFLANNEVTQAQKKQIARGILEGLKYLHDQKRIHRDLKPANILIFRKVDKQGNTIEIVPLITDFGLTKVVKEDDYVSGSDVELSDGRGTAAYKAPEQIEDTKAHFNLDLWAFGVILYEMMLGERPFNRGTGSDSQLLKQITTVAIPDALNTIPQPYQAIIKRCLVKDIHKRARKADELIKLLEEKKAEKPSTYSAEEELGTDERSPEAEEKVADKPKQKSTPPQSLKSYLILILICVVSLSYYFYLESIKPATIKELDSQMVFVKGGRFDMGSNEGEADEKPVHSKTVDSFYMGKYEVTQAQWREVMGNNPSGFKNCDDCPVERVSWNDVQIFLKKLNAQTGKTYRLPTEAEWEYAAGGGATNRTRFGNGKNRLDPGEANFDASAASKTDYSVAGTSRQKTTKVGSFAPNRLGLYDMSGNVWEWCQDWYKGYPGSSGVPDYTNSHRVLRGGSWYFTPNYARVANRISGAPDDRARFDGFRLVSQSQ